MTPLGRGLASLIPRRHKENAEDILEQIDSMESIADEPANVTALRKASLGIVEEEEEEAVNDEPMTLRRHQLNVVEEDDEPVQPVAPMPRKPLVTPLTIEEEEEETVNDEPAVVVEEEADDIVLEVQDEPEAVAEEDSEEEEMDDAEEEEEDNETEPAEEVEPEPEKSEEDSKEEENSEEEETDNAEEEEEVETVTEEIEEKEAEEPVVEAEPEIAKEPEQAVVKKDMYDDLSPVGDRKVLGEKVEYVAIGDIQVNPLQPRHVFDPSELTDLVQSIEQHGLMQPLVVIKNTGEDGYQLIAGERRLRATKQLGWDKVPCVVRTDVRSDRHRLELALTENVQRQNLNPIEEAMGYQRLNEEYGLTHEEIGRRVGRSRVGITNIIRLLQLPAEIQRGLMEGKISMGHARAILMIPDEEKQIRFYNHVIEEGLTVRKAENRARNIQRTMNLNDPMRTKLRGRPQLAIKYDGLLQDKFGYNARVKFENSKNRFEVVFYAFSEGEAEELIGRMLSLKGKGLPERVDEDVIAD